MTFFWLPPPFRENSRKFRTFSIGRLPLQTYRLSDRVAETPLSRMECDIYLFIYQCNDYSFSRSVLVKYSDRGLADDVFWFNGGLKLFEILFWIINIFLMLAHETNITILFFTGRMYSSLQRWTNGILSLVIIFFLPVVQLQKTKKTTKNRPL